MYEAPKAGGREENMRIRRLLAAGLCGLAVLLGALAGAVPAQANHATNPGHYGAWTWGGTIYSPYRYVYVYDRTSSQSNSDGLKAFIQAHNTLWATYTQLPYFVYVDDRASSTDACSLTNFVPGYSLILVCSGRPTGHEGVSTVWSPDANNHVQGIASVYLDGADDTGRSYSGMCHEFLHVMLNTVNHNPDATSCFRSTLPGEWYGYDQHDVDTLLAHYHPVGGIS